MFVYINICLISKNMMINRHLVSRSFSVMGYELSKTNIVIDPKISRIKDHVFFESDNYQSYIMSHNSVSDDFSVHNFLTDDIVCRGYVLEKEIQDNFKMKENFDNMYQQHLNVMMMDNYEKKEQLRLWRKYLNEKSFDHKEKKEGHDKFIKILDKYFEKTPRKSYNIYPYIITLTTDMNIFPLSPTSHTTFVSDIHPIIRK